MVARWSTSGRTPRSSAVPGRLQNSCEVAVLLTESGTLERLEVAGRVGAALPGQPLGGRSRRSLAARRVRRMGIDPISLVGQSATTNRNSGAESSTADRSGRLERPDGDRGPPAGGAGDRLVLARERDQPGGRARRGRSGARPGRRAGALRARCGATSTTSASTSTSRRSRCPGTGPRSPSGRTCPARRPGCWSAAWGLRRRWATDVVQLTGRGRAEGADWPGLRAELPGTRVQGEHSAVALQTEPVAARPRRAPGPPGSSACSTPDHPAATSAERRPARRSGPGRPAAALLRPEPCRTRPGIPHVPDHRSLFGTPAAFPGRPLTDDELDRLAGTRSDRGRARRAGPAQLLHPRRRPRRHRGQAGPGAAAARPPAAVRDAAAPGGVQRLLDGLDGRRLLHPADPGPRQPGHDPVGAPQLSRPGPRVGAAAVRTAGAPRRTGCCSAPPRPGGWRWTECRWWYARPNGLLRGPDQRTRRGGSRSRSRSRSSTDRRSSCWPQPTCRGSTRTTGPAPGRPRRTAYGSRRRSAGPRRRCSPRARSGWSGPPDSGEPADDGPLFRDGRSRGLPWVTVDSRTTDHWRLTLRPELVEPDADAPDPNRTSGPGPPAQSPSRPPDTAAGRELARIGTALPWFVHDAVDALPVAAGPGAVHRRCLGYPRRQPGAGRRCCSPSARTRSCASLILMIMGAERTR